MESTAIKIDNGDQQNSFNRKLAVSV